MAARGKTSAGTRWRAGVRKRQRNSGAPLERGLIVRTALKLVDREGLKALSMRRLGAELSVDPMAVYYHLPNKQALLDAIVEAVMASIDLSVDDRTKGPEERILCAARAYRDVLLAHANALPILLAHGPATPAAMRPVELLTGILRDAGLGPAEALAGMNVIAAAVRGAVGMGPHKEISHEEMDAMWRALPAEEFPNLHEAMREGAGSFDAFFDFGMRVLAHGLLAGAPKCSDALP
jgi:TetR/AcrR family transcriptional regulator, tetracycline repressor protein